MNNLNRKKPRGRLKQRWLDVVKREIQKLKPDWRGDLNHGYNKEKWKNGLIVQILNIGTETNFVCTLDQNKSELRGHIIGAFYCYHLWSVLFINISFIYMIDTSSNEEEIKWVYNINIARGKEREFQILFLHF